MIVMFVRHADAKNDKLTKLGKRQCELMCEYEEEYKFAKIYSSPAQRCIDTAKALDKKFNIGIEVENLLKERDQLENDVPKTEQEQLWYDNYLNPEFENDYPEGCKNYLERTFKAYRKIINEHFDKNENAIIVAHSGTTYTLAAFIHGITKGKDIKWIRIGNCSRIYYEIKEKV